MTESHFTYIAFKGFLCGVFVHLATHYIVSKSFETLRTSPNHCPLMEKISLGQWWCTAESFVDFTCGSDILPLLFMYLNFWKFANSCKITWNFVQMTESDFFDEKT